MADCPTLDPYEIEILRDFHLDAVTDCLSGRPDREMALYHARRAAELADAAEAGGAGAGQ